MSFFEKVISVLKVNFFFRFCQILFNLACMLTVHHEKCFVPALLKSLLITFLIILSLEKEIIVLEKGLEEVFNFG